LSSLTNCTVVSDRACNGYQYLHRAVIAVTALVAYSGQHHCGCKNSVHRSQQKQYTHEGDENPSIHASDDRPVVGNHAGDGMRPSRFDNDSRGTRMLPPHGGAVWKLDDAAESFLLQGSGTDQHCSSPGAGCRTDSSPHHCCDTPSRIVRGVARGDSALPSFVS
jgi:hypothetical protein